MIEFWIIIKDYMIGILEFRFYEVVYFVFFIIVWKWFYIIYFSIKVIINIEYGDMFDICIVMYLFKWKNFIFYLRIR